jgi:hypothetical protein
MLLYGSIKLAQIILGITKFNLWGPFCIMKYTFQIFLDYVYKNIFAGPSSLPIVMIK